MANLIVNTVMLGLMAVDFGIMMGAKQPDPNKQTALTYITGSGLESDGNMPHGVIKGQDGTRIVAHHDYGHMNEKESKTMILDNNEDDEGHTKQLQPEYIGLVMQKNDPICLSGIMVSGNGAQYSWTGDMGFTCGAEWYESKFAFGGSNYPPKCVWLDGDTSNDIVATSLTLHMPDFLGEQGLVDQYAANNSILCQNEARMTFWPQKFEDFNEIPHKIFSPPLEYVEGGGLKDPTIGIDRQQRGYPDGTNLPQQSGKKRGARNSNIRPEHLTISHIDTHSAERLCQSETSRGPDFVHVPTKQFCDMSEKRLWPLCDNKHTRVCFDVQTKTMKGAGRRMRKRDGTLGEPAPEKLYKTHEEWSL